MSDVDNAIRRWWDHELPKIRADLIKAYRVGSLDEPVARMMMRAMREAFIAGWKARDAQSAEQGSLFDAMEGGDPKE